MYSPIMERQSTCSQSLAVIAVQFRNKSVQRASNHLYLSLNSTSSCTLFEILLFHLLLKRAVDACGEIRMIGFTLPGCLRKPLTA